MRPIDWAVMAAYAVGVLAIGAWFTRRAGNSADDDLVAGRKLPWWVIGFSDVASAAGADPLWILVIFSGAFIGLYRFFWIAAVVSLPLGILWARYWRRLALTSPGEIFEVRYGGVAAARFRGFYVVYGALVPTGILLAYVLKGFAEITAPFLEWSVAETLIAFCAISCVYTMLSGLLGVAYSDVPQFVLVMAGRVWLASFKDLPYWQSFALLFFSGWAVIVSVTLCTRPERPEILRRFFERVRPPGVWGPVVGALGSASQDATRAERTLDLAAAAAGFVFCAALVAAMAAGFGGRWALFGTCAGVTAVAGLVFARYVIRAEGVRRCLPDGSHVEPPRRAS